MKREQQIEKASIGRYPEWGEQQHALELAFQAGAIWADSHPHWISVDDELPKENGRYLFYHTILGVQSSYYYNDLTLDKAVTHWMPLTAPPTCSVKPNNCEKGGEQ